MIAIGNHLWHCTVVGALAALVAVTLRSHQAKVRFWIWFIASVKFLVPFSLLISFGARTGYSPDMERTLDVVSAPPLTIRAAQPFGLESPAAMAVQAQTPEPDWWAVVTAVVWCGGCLLIIAKRIGEWQLLRFALRASCEASIASEIPVRFTRALLEPSLIGWRQPVLLLPSGIVDSLTTPQLHSVLTHEVVHARRKDNLFAAVHMVIEVLFWFHPLVWVIGAQLVKERERACDEEVLRRGTEPRVYAEGILAVCRSYARSPWIVASGVTGWSMKQRMEEIMTNCGSRELTRFRTAALITAGACVVALPIITGIFNASLLLAQPLPSRFKSVTVKACSDHPNVRKGSQYTSSVGMLRTGCVPLADAQGLGLIQRAYVRFGANGGTNWPTVIPVKGQPSWFASDLYDIAGIADPATPQETMEGAMLRSVLEDRFKLRLREESVTVPVYHLTTGSGGLKFSAFADGTCTPMPAAVPPPRLPQGQRYCMVRVGMQPPAIDAEGVNLAEFAELLSRVLDRPVIDRTRISGKFTAHMKFTPDSSTTGFLAGGEMARFATAPAPGTPTIMSALEQLGLRLEPGNGIQKLLVIDHVEKPVVE